MRPITILAGIAAVVLTVGVGTTALASAEPENTRVVDVVRDADFNGETVTRTWVLPAGTDFSTPFRQRYPQPAVSPVPDCTDGGPIYVQEDRYKHETDADKAVVAELDAAGVLRSNGDDGAVFLQSWHVTINVPCEPEVEEPSVEPEPTPSTTTPSTPPATTPTCAEEDPESCEPQPTDEPTGDIGTPTSTTAPEPTPTVTETVTREVEVGVEVEVQREATAPRVSEAPAAVAIPGEPNYTG